MPSTPEQVLRARARELDELRARLEGDEHDVRTARGDDTADDEHDPEGSTLSGEWQRLDAVLRAVIAERREVDAALQRVDDGTYGLCVQCGKPIPAARLEARPMAVTCVACAGG